MILHGGKMVIKCVFPEDMIRRPILYELTKRFALVSNIKQAMITSESGWVIVEITGEKQEVVNGIKWLRQIGVQVYDLFVATLLATGASEK